MKMITHLYTHSRIDINGSTDNVQSKESFLVKGVWAAFEN